MNLSWFLWYKHFHFVYLFASVLFLGSLASTISGDEPTEEPEENLSSTITSTTSTPAISASTTAETSISRSTNTAPSTSTTESHLVSPEESKVMNESSTSSERHEQHEARAFHPSGLNLNWKTAGRMLSRVLRMFRESLLEGTKVAHMFKEDFDEGMSSIMRQNRGVKVDSQSGQQQNDNSGTGSLFDSQMLREGVLGGILRFMGVNSKQMGVIALNVLIILAEWITNSMIGGNDAAGATSRMIKSNLLHWANTGKNFQVEKIITQVKSHTLPEKLIDTLSDKTGNSTSCVQLLLCKMSPVIWGFQDTMKDQLNIFGFQEETGWKTASKTSSTTSSPEGNGTYEEPESIFQSRGILGTSEYLLDKFLGHLPPTERMVDFGDRCEAKFPQCQLLKFSAVK